MRAQLSFVVDVDSEKSLGDLRDLLGEVLEEHDDVVHLVAASSALDEQDFTVFGAIKGKPDQTWREVVHAADSAAARAKVLAADSKRTITGVLRGDVEVL